MSYESDFDELMPQTVTHSTFKSYNGYGKPSHSTTTTSYSARVVTTQKLVRTFDGTEKLAKTLAYIASTGVIDPRDKLTLPDTSTPVILAVDIYPDEDGQHHVRVAFG